MRELTDGIRFVGGGQKHNVGEDLVSDNLSNSLAALFPCSPLYCTGRKCFGISEYWGWGCGGVSELWDLSWICVWSGGCWIGSWLWLWLWLWLAVVVVVYWIGKAYAGPLSTGPRTAHNDKRPLQISFDHNRLLLKASNNSDPRQPASWGPHEPVTQVEKVFF